jgi:hypothetical protein
MSATSSPHPRADGREPTRGHVARRGLVGAGAAAAALVVAGIAVVPDVAHAAAGVAAPIACPTPFPTASAVDGVSGTGFTVERGTKPEPFTAKVIGRITDGIAPGIDMIMAEVSSPALQRAGGVWAGMSGSPVYSADGRLIGAVSYGLSGAPTRIAGITPAASMRALLLQTATTGTPAVKRKVAVSADAARRIAATGAAAAAQAAGGFSRLAVPVWVSGATGGKAAPLLARLQQKMPDARVMAGGASATTTQGPASQIVAGGNFAASFAYGDATLAAVGTTTFVCNGVAVAFGHPFLASGASSMTVHAADAVYVQPDAVAAPFKVSNVKAPVGTLDGDYVPGIRGRLGTLPATTGITSSLAKPGGAAVTGTTKSSYGPLTPDAVAFHVFYNLQRVLNADPAGSAALTITVKGVRAGGKAFTVTRTDHYSSTGSISFAVADQVYTQINSLVAQPFEPVKLTSVSITGTVSTAVKEYRVTSLKVKKGTTFVPVTGTIQAKAGTTLTLQATLSPYQGVGATKTLTLPVAVPSGSVGSSGAVAVMSGNREDVAEPASFSQVLTSFQSTARRDTVLATLDLGTGAPVTTRATADQSVADYYRSVPVEVS